MSWAYGTSFQGGFVFDDIPTLVENPSIRSIWPLSRSLWAPGEVTTSGRPLANLSFALNYALAPADARDVMRPSGIGVGPGARERFRRNVWRYHLGNLLIHLAAALTLAGVVRRSLAAPRLRLAVGPHATPVAYASALVWAVHPLTTESVTYIVQRVESLMGLFYLLTLYCAIRAWDSERLRGYWIAGAVLACACGMATKENMVSAPLVVWLWDFVFHGPDRMKTRRALYVGLAATWVILGSLVALEPRERSVGVHLDWDWYPFLLTQSEIILHYLKLAMWPSPLVFDYGWPAAESLREVWAPFTTVSALAVVTAALAVRQHPASVPLAAFFLVLAPTSSVLPITTQVAAEHRMYLPLACVVVLVVVSAAWAGRRVADRHGVGPAVAALTALIAIGAAVLPLAAATRARNLDYVTEEALYLDTIRKRPSNWRAYVAYGAVLLEQQRFQEAEPYLRTALTINPGSARAHMNLGGTLCALDRCKAGVQHLEEAARLEPELREVQGMLGEAYAGFGDEARAIEHYERAGLLMPSAPFALHRLASLLVFSTKPELRDPVRAAALVREAIRLDSGQAEFYQTLAAAHVAVSNNPAAIEAAREGLEVARATGQPQRAMRFEAIIRALEQRQ